METKGASPFWWVKSAPGEAQREQNGNNLTIPQLDLDISSSLADFLEKERNILNSNREDRTEVDVGSIIEEINRVAAKSPLGPYEPSTGERSIEDIMKEVIESSRSFEQLSQRSKTSLNITELNSNKDSTPTPKSISPLPNDSESETYSEDFSEESKVHSIPSPQAVLQAVEKKLLQTAVPEKFPEKPEEKLDKLDESPKDKQEVKLNVKQEEEPEGKLGRKLEEQLEEQLKEQLKEKLKELKQLEELQELQEQQENRLAVVPQPKQQTREEMEEEQEEKSMRDELIKTLEIDNKHLREDIRQMRIAETTQEASE